MESSTGCQVEGDETYSSVRKPTWIYGPSDSRKWLTRASLISAAVHRTFRDRGLLYTAKKSVMVVFAKLWARSAEPNAAPPTTLSDNDVVLNLRPGEWVEIKSFPDILATLDSKGKYQGLSFTREMKEHCGQRYRVFKRLDVLFNEYTRQQRKVKNTVLLEGVYCRGTGFGCDRSCFHFWREVWLKRVSGPQPITRAER